VSTPAPRYETLRRAFSWTIPSACNIGTACSDDQPARSLALVDVGHDGQQHYSFGELTETSNRLANALRAIGVCAGDRVGILLPQSVEVGLAHLAVYKLGAIAMPMSVLFGPQALSYRLADSAARVVITDSARLEVAREVAGEVGDVTVLVTASGIAGAPSFWELIGAASPAFTPVATGPDTPALLIYTSGTTGAPKGALHGHGALLGHLPGFELSHDGFPLSGDRMWTPADWAWIGGLLDVLLPCWYHGRPVVAASRGRFDPEWALDLIAKTQVRNVFLPPTVLKLMRQAGIGHAGVELRSIMSGGEPLGAEMLEWARDAFGVVVNGPG
jgi:acetyl-CoA synthetase